MGKFDRAAHEQRDAELIEERLRLGDAPEVVREVDHAALFRRMSTARAAAQELERRGMRVDSIGRYWIRPMHVMVTFRRAQGTDLETVRSTTEELTEFCSQYGGVYDGWGAMVVGRTSG